MQDGRNSIARGGRGRRTLLVPLLLVMVLTLSVIVVSPAATGASASAAPVVTALNPNAGAQGTTVNVSDLSGTGFSGTPAVWLHKTGQGSIGAANVILVSSTRLTCSFAVPLGAAVGAWDVSVRNPDGQAGTLPGGFTVSQGAPISWFFAEGTARSGFDTYFTVQNPGGLVAEVTLTYLTGTGETKNQKISVAPTSRATVHPVDVLGSGNTPAFDFSTVVTCSNGQQVVAERPMYFDYAGSGGYGWTGGSDVLGATAAARTWYFAEGTARPGFDTYICLLNPYSQKADVTLTYMKGDGSSVAEAVSVAPYSRSTVIPRGKLGTGEDAAHDFATRVTASRNIVVERPMYFNYRGIWTGGHDVIGATSTSSAFYFAEGTARPGFDEYFCIQNPSGTGAIVTLKYLRGDGTTASEQVTVAPNARATVFPRNKLGTGDDAAHDFSTVVTADQQIVAERPMYFNYGGAWSGGSDVMGATWSSTAYYFAEGTTRPGFAPYFSIQNPGSTQANVKLTYMRGDGTTVEDTVAVPANARATVNPISKLGIGDSAANDFSTLVTSDQPTVIERPMYFDYRGWTGGSCVVGYGPYNMTGGARTLDGIPLPAYSGKVGREQHLCLTVPQEPAATHYAISGVPAAAQNGMAWEEGGGSGYGAWGKAAPVDDERYYVCMRWNYTDLHGQPVLAPKDWYYKKRLLVINPANNTRVVASIIEYGPAPWTDRVSGLSPEAMLVLGADTDDNLIYYWAQDQSTPLGPI